jgi:hypothetical protein
MKHNYECRMDTLECYCIVQRRCSPLEANRRFRETCRLLLQCRRISQANMFFRNVGWFSTDYMELYPWRYCHRCENFIYPTMYSAVCQGSSRNVWPRCTQGIANILSSVKGCAWLIDGVWIGWLDLLTLYTHNSELQAITALSLHNSPLNT